MQVETFGAMAKTEKIAFILEQVQSFLVCELYVAYYFKFGTWQVAGIIIDNQLAWQVRLCLDRKDFIRAQILSRKINTRSFTETPKQKKKAKEAESIIEEPAPDVPTLPELRRIYYELMIRFGLSQVFLLY